MRSTFSSWAASHKLPGTPVRNRCQFPRWRRLFLVEGTLSFVSVLALLTATPALASLDDAIVSALQTIEQYAQGGYTVHEEDEWGGDLGVKESKVIPHTLLQGNEYWFCLGTDVQNSRVAIHVYNDQGKLVEATAWQDGSHAGAKMLNPPTASYYIVIKINASPAVRTHWAMVYGSKPVGGRKAL